MGSVGTKLGKPVKNWNIESRAQKIISQDKPRPAPTYNSTQKQIELVNKLEPDYQDKAQRKDQQLDEYLKKVYVNSTEVQEIEQKQDPERPLPKDRLIHEGFEYGFYEPKEVSPGRISLRQVLELLSNHKKEPEKYTAEYLAAQYKLEKEVVENILAYHNLFTVYNMREDSNHDIIMSHIPISQRTGIQVRFTEDDVQDPKEKRDEESKQFIEMTREPLPVEEEKKRIT